MSAIHRLRKKNIIEENKLLYISNTEKQKHKNLQTLKKNASLLRDRVERLSFMITEIHSVLKSTNSVRRF